MSNLFGSVYEELGSSNSNLILRSKGKIKVQWGNKFIDLIDDNGNINSGISNIIKEVSSKDQIKKDGFYFLDGNLIANIKGNQILLSSQSENTYVSFITEQNTTEDQKFTALKNLGFYYDSISEISSVTKGIVYVEDQKSLYIFQDGNISKYYAEIPNPYPKQFVITKSGNEEGALVINGQGSQNGLKFDSLTIYSNQDSLVFNSQGNVVFDTNGIKVNSIESKDSSFNLYTINGISTLEVDNLVVRNNQSNNNIFDIDIIPLKYYKDQNILKRFEINNNNLILFVKYKSNYSTNDQLSFFYSTNEGITQVKLNIDSKINDYSYNVTQIDTNYNLSNIKNKVIGLINNDLVIGKTGNLYNTKDYGLISKQNLFYSTKFDKEGTGNKVFPFYSDSLYNYINGESLFKNDQNDITTYNKVLTPLGIIKKMPFINKANYNSNSHNIYFYDYYGNQLCYIDATDFIKDGMVSNVEVVNEYLVITFNTDSGKEPIRIRLIDLFGGLIGDGTYTIKVKVGNTITNVSDFTANQSENDDITFIQGDNITLTPDSTNRKITISSTDTKNTAGSTNKAATKMFLVGATSQAANPQTYSNVNVYIGTDNCLYSNGTKVLTAHQSLSNYVTLDGNQTITGGKTFSGTGDSILTVDRNNTNPTWIKFAKNGTVSGYLGVNNNHEAMFHNGTTQYEIWHSGNLTNVSQLTNDSGYVTSSGVTSITLKAGTGISLDVNNTAITSTGTRTITNSGVRSTTINGNYLRVNTNGTDADLTIPYATSAARFLAGEITSSNTSGDADTMQLDGTGTVYSVLTNYSGNGKWQNMPLSSGNDYGGVVEIKGTNANLKMQLAWAALHNEVTAPTTGLWFRARANKGYVSTDWHQVAMTDSNVASATKLQTARTLWGQSFDGTANVSGAITGATNITASGNASIGGTLTVNSGIELGHNNEINSQVSTGNLHLNYRVSGNVTICKGGGNVCIGALTPSYKLHVAGTFYASGNSSIGGTLGVTGAITASDDCTITKTTTAAAKFSAINSAGTIELVNSAYNMGVRDPIHQSWIIGCDRTNTWLGCGNVAIDVSPNTDYKFYVSGTIGADDVYTADSAKSVSQRLQLFEKLVLNGYEYVDLGLPSGNLWATCNIGASSQEQIGLYFAWGAEKGYAKGSGHNFNKAASEFSDTVHVEMSALWEFPSSQDFLEINTNCTKTWTTINSIPGYKFTSNQNGNTIFFPAGGYYSGTALNDEKSRGRYWTKTASSSISGYATGFQFISGTTYYANIYDIKCGFNVRGVVRPSRLSSILDNMYRINDLDNRVSDLE